MRLIRTYAGPTCYAKVYRDVKWNEYRIKFYVEGTGYLHAADYLTNDKQDALDSAAAWTARDRQIWILTELLREALRKIEELKE